MYEDLVGFTVFFVGLGFFLLVLYLIITDERRQDRQRIMEAREFGFDPRDHPNYAHTYSPRRRSLL